jgi:hypothetical protein
MSFSMAGPRQSQQQQPALARQATTKAKAKGLFAHVFNPFCTVRCTPPHPGSRAMILVHAFAREMIRQTDWCTPCQRDGQTDRPVHTLSERWSERQIYWCTPCH